MNEAKRLAGRTWTGWLAAATVAVFLAGCGGGGSEAGGDTVDPGGIELPSRPAARLEVAPAAVLLTASGQRQQLTVRAFDVDGVEVRADGVWKSSRPEQVSIGVGGLIEAQTALGASQVSVEAANGVRSAPVLVSVARPAAGVVLLDDAQVVGTATAVDPEADPDNDNPYEVLLSGIAVPAPGSLLLGREGKTVGGEVISAVAEGGAVRVRLRTVPIATLMQTAEIHEELDFTGLDPEFPAELTADYDIAKVDGEYVFTPKPGSAARSAVAGKQRANKLTEFKLGPYKCDFATPELPVSLAQPAQFSMKFEPKYQIDFGRDTGLQKLILRAETAFKTKANLTLSAGGILNIDCAAPLYTRLMPLPGYAGLILSGEVKAGLGFELEGTLTIPLLGVELTSETRGPLEMGLDCVAGECRLVRNYDPVNTNQLRFITPDVANIRTEVFLYGYGFAKLKAGATLLENLRMDLVTARSGLKLEGSFAPPTSQLAPAASDYKSDYKLSVLNEVVAGSLNKTGDSAFRKLLQKLGIFKFNLLKFQASVPLATSPKGVATRDKDAVADGDTLGFKVTLDPATVEFPFVGYNVARVLVMHSVPGQPAREVARVDAAKGQTSFDLAWVVDGTFGQLPGEFFAFVETRLPTPFSLELGKVGAAPPVLAGTFAMTKIVEEPLLGLSRDFARHEEFRVTGEVEQIPGEGRGAAFLKMNASYMLRQEQVILSPEIGVCSFLRTDTTVKTLSGNSSVASAGGLSLFVEDSRWRLLSANLDFPLTGTLTKSRRFTNITGDCRESTSDTDATEAIAFGQDGNAGISASLFQPLPDGNFGELVGPVTIGASGKHEIHFDGTLARSSPSITIQLAMHLTERPPVGATTDVALELIAPATALPDGALTYAVNLVNKSEVAATALRAEFALPAGFTIVGTTGWDGCTTIGTTAVCSTASLAAAERRAFLIDVRAPAAGGRYTVRARVAAVELDSNFADNQASATTDIDDPR